MLFQQEVRSRERFNSLLNKVENDEGVMSDYILSNWQTRVIRGSEPSAEYLLVYDVTRGTSHMKETFMMKKTDTDSIKIISYRVDINMDSIK